MVGFLNAKTNLTKTFYFFLIFIGLSVSNIIYLYKY